MAKLIFKYATMNSGKSMDLIRTVYNYEENDCKVLVMKPSIDSKAGEFIETRAGLRRKVDFLVSQSDSILKSLIGNLDDVRCIFVDEAQFLTKKQVGDLFFIAHLLDITVICYGLRDDFRLRAFEGSARLLELADILEEFKTLCHCGGTARFCGRKIDDKYVTSGETVVIDGTSNVEYVPLCADCYIKEVMGYKSDTIKKLVKVR